MYLDFYKPNFSDMAKSEADRDPKLLEFQFLSRPILEIPTSSEAAASQEGKQQGEEKEDEERTCQSAADSKENRILQEDEENDGYQTPTSSENKITAHRQCPPAPKKPRSVPLKKRKTGVHSCYFSIETEEIESIFRPVKLEFNRKIKKARKG